MALGGGLSPLLRPGVEQLQQGGQLCTTSKRDVSVTQGLFATGKQRLLALLAQLRKQHLAVTPRPAETPQHRRRLLQRIDRVKPAKRPEQAAQTAQRDAHIV